MPGLLRQLARGLTSPFMRMGAAYNEAAKRNPLGVGIVTTVLKTSAADIFAQKVIERKDEIDWKRNGVFTIFGFAYLGCWQYYLYNKVFVRIAPSVQAVVGARGVGPVLTFLDQCVHHPLMYFPVFYLLRGAMMGDAPQDSLAKYKADAWENLKALWMVWVPAQLVNFSVVPLHLRVPFVAGVSFAWTIILSVLRGALNPAKQRAMEELHHLEDAASERLHAGVQVASEALHGWEEQLASSSHAANVRLHELGSSVHVRVRPLERSAQHAHERMHAWSEHMHLAERAHLVEQTVPAVLADDGRQASRPAPVSPVWSEITRLEHKHSTPSTHAAGAELTGASSEDTTTMTAAISNAAAVTPASSSSAAVPLGSSSSAADVQSADACVLVLASAPPQGIEQDGAPATCTQMYDSPQPERVHVPASPLVAAACS